MSGVQPAMQFDSLRQQQHAAHFGMWVFLGTEVLFFGPVLLGYLYGRFAMPDAFATASRETDLVLGTLNTVLLLTSSLCMALAVELRRSDALRGFRMALAATIALGSIFLAIKAYEYIHDWHKHLIPGLRFSLEKAPDGQQGGAELFFFVYFAGTGLHALHLAIGVGMLTLLLLRSRDAGAVTPRRIEVAGLYWHFVDVVWIFLFPALYLVERS